MKSADKFNLSKLDVTKIIKTTMKLRAAITFKEILTFVNDLLIGDFGFCLDTKQDRSNGKMTVEYTSVGITPELIENYLKNERYQRDMELFSQLMEDIPSEICWLKGGDIKFNEPIAFMEDYNDCLTMSYEGYTRDTFVFLKKKSFRKEDRMIADVILPYMREANVRLMTQIERAENCNITRREMEILHWLKEGKTSWEISQILDISESTAKFHVQNIKEKLDASNKTQAIVIAIKEGILDGYQ